MRFVKQAEAHELPIGRRRLPGHGAVGKLLAEEGLHLNAFLHVQSLTQSIDVTGTLAHASHVEASGPARPRHLHLTALPLDADLDGQPGGLEGQPQALLVPIDQRIVGLAVDGLFGLHHLLRQLIAQRCEIDQPEQPLRVRRYGLGQADAPMFGQQRGQQAGRSRLVGVAGEGVAAQDGIEMGK